jgi:hypothetical protein
MLRQVKSALVPFMTIAVVPSLAIGLIAVVALLVRLGLVPGAVR